LFTSSVDAFIFVLINQFSYVLVRSLIVLFGLLASLIHSLGILMSQLFSWIFNTHPVRIFDVSSKRSVLPHPPPPQPSFSAFEVCGFVTLMKIFQGMSTSGWKPAAPVE
jgi:hypothetical protein